MSSSSPIRTAVVGTGLSATVFHHPFIHLHPAFTLTAIIDRKASSSATQASFPDARIFPSLDNLLAPGNHENLVDLVVIATPPETHFAFAKAALLAGKHVVIEKPLCPTSQEAGELQALAQERGRVLAVYQNRRFDSDFLTVLKVIESGRLGDLVEYEAHFDRFRPALKDGGVTWKEAAELPGSGLLYDLGSHLVDQALYLFGKPVAVTATIFKQRAATRIDDAFHLVLQYPRMTATLKAGMLLAAPRPRFALYGNNGCFVKYGLDVQEPQLRAGMKITDPSFAIEPVKDEGTLTWQAEGGVLKSERIPTEKGDYMQFYEGLARAINTGSEPPVTAASVKNVIRVIELAYQSHNEKRTIPLSD